MWGATAHAESTSLCVANFSDAATGAHGVAEAAQRRAREQPATHAAILLGSRRRRVPGLQRNGEQAF